MVRKGLNGLPIESLRLFTPGVSYRVYFVNRLLSEACWLFPGTSSFRVYWTAADKWRANARRAAPLASVCYTGLVLIRIHCRKNHRSRNRERKVTCSHAIPFENSISRVKLRSLSEETGNNRIENANMQGDRILFQESYIVSPHLTFPVIGPFEAYINDPMICWNNLISASLIL